MRVRFWGVRGAFPAAGREFNRYGGNTPCVSVEAPDSPLLVLDAGTGIIGLGRELMLGRFAAGLGRAVLLLSHTHWDHIQGFPFFQPAFVRGNALTIVGSCGCSGLLEGILEGQMNPHYNPVQSLRNLGANIDIDEIGEGEPRDFGGVRVLARAVPHGHTSSLALRIEAGGRALVYVPDAGYADSALSDELRALYRAADCLIHDCTFTPEDRALRESRGNSAIDVAARVAAAGSVKRLVMFHYDQDYTDEQVDTLRERCRAYLDDAPGGHHVELTAAREGLVLEI